MSSRAYGFAALATAVVGALALYVLIAFQRISPAPRAFDGKCTPVAGVAGPADLQIDPVSRLAFVSSFDADGDAERGGVFAFAIDDFLDANSWRDRTAGEPAAFEPLGLYVYRDADVARLFVVNSAGKTVELYDVSPEGELTHVETFTERRLTSPNDVVAVGPRSFYVTNDVEPGRNSALGKLQFLLRAGSGRVFYFDGVSWSVAAEGLRFANGVAVSADGRRLYAAETAGGSLRIYDRDPTTGVLTLRHVVRMGVQLDNINVDADGALWMGMQPKSLLSIDGRSPSAVIRYDERNGRPERVYAAQGEALSASSAAALHEKTLLIGALNEEKFLVCKLPS